MSLCPVAIGQVVAELGWPAQPMLHFLTFSSSGGPFASPRMHLRFTAGPVNCFLSALRHSLCHGVFIQYIKFKKLQTIEEKRVYKILSVTQASVPPSRLLIGELGDLETCTGVIPMEPSFLLNTCQAQEKFTRSTHKINAAESFQGGDAVRQRVLLVPTDSCPASGLPLVGHHRCPGKTWLAWTG